MDKETLSNYGWIVICVLVLSVMIALATPFGTFISDAVQNTTQGLFKTEDNAIDKALGNMGIVPSVEELQKEYKFEYYSALNDAINDINNTTIGDNSNKNKDNAVAGIYIDETGMPTVVLLKDTTESQTITINKNLSLNLGGHTLSFEGEAKLVLSEMVENATIDGRLQNSEIKGLPCSNNIDVSRHLISVYCNSLKVMGGKYISDVNSVETNNYVFFIAANPVCQFKNCTISASTTTGTTRTIQSQSNNIIFENCKLSGSGNGGQVAFVLGATFINCDISMNATGESAQAVYVYKDTYAEIENSNISIVSESGVAYGVYGGTSSEVTINNCAISTKSKTGNTCGVYGDTSSEATINSCTVSAESETGNAYGTYGGTSANKTVAKCTVFAKSINKNACGCNFNKSSGTMISSTVNTVTENGSTYAVYCNASDECNLSKCNITASSNYAFDNNTYTTTATGLYNNGGKVNIKNCNIKGVHSGVSSTGPLTVDGGTYEGYGHGGFYFGGANIIHHVKNATIKQCDMPKGFIDKGADTNNAGFYVGGASGRNNISVYIDNCDIYGKSKSAVLRGGDGEQNNSIYISNSQINTSAKIRIDDTHKLYIGKGCNFTADNTTSPNAVITTDKEYAVIQ